MTTRVLINQLTRPALRLAFSLVVLALLLSAARLHAAPADVLDPTTITRAVAPALRAAVNLKGADASDDVKLVADWIVRNDKQKGNPFLIADKVNGLLFAFLGNGELFAKTRALYGAMRSDSMTQVQADKTWRDLRPADMITPAGIYPARGYRSPNYGAAIRFAEFANSNLLIHRAPAEWRRKHLESGNMDKVHITYGCINVLPDVMDNVLLPILSGDSTVFILPELQSPKSFFAINDVPERLRTAQK